MATNTAELRPGVVIRGPVPPEPVEILVVQAIGDDLTATAEGRASAPRTIGVGAGRALPGVSSERHWVEGVQARKKGLGL